MKPARAVVFGVLFSTCYLHSISQDQKIPINEPDYGKPKIFSNLRQKMNLKTSGIENLFDLSVGTSVKTELAGNFNFNGIVVSKSDQKNQSFKTVVIRASDKEGGASFTFTKIQKADGSFSYSGRILSKNSIDAYEIRNENGQYILQKKNYYDLVNE